MTTLKRFELWLARTAIGVWMSKTFASRIDPMLFRLSGGRFTSMGPIIIPQLVLTTRGRKSGQKRDAQLAYTDLDGVAYVVASNFGGERHPAWSYNLLAEPQAEMQLRDERVPVIAHCLSNDEKEAVWARLCDNVPNYSSYEEQTEREIKVYRLSPCDAPAKPA